MKSTFSLMFLCIPLILFSQSETKPHTVKTKVETFAEEPGTLIEKNVEEIGKVGLVAVKVLTLKNLITGDKISGLSFEYLNSATSILDADEIDGLVKSLTIMKGSVATTRPVYTEITYKSRTGFEVGAYFDLDKNERFSTGQKKWIYYLKLDAPTQIKVSLRPEDFMALCGYVEAVKSKI